MSNIRVDGGKTRILVLLRSTFHTELLTWDTCKSSGPTNNLSILDQAYLIDANSNLLSRLWHGLVTFGCAITIPDEEAEVAKELLTSALIAASLTNDLFSFEKERNDKNVQNAVLVVIREHDCSEEDAREICKQRIRLEVAEYIRVVKHTKTRTDLSDDTKRYIDTMQYTLSGNAAWSTQCPRYHTNAKWNELQLLRAEHGVAKYPARWPPKNATNSHSANGGGVHLRNGADNHINGHSESTEANGHKRKRNTDSQGDDVRVNGTNGVKKSVRTSQQTTDSLVLADIVSSALDWNLPELSDNVS